VTTQKKNFNWTKLAEKGKIEEEIKVILKRLKNSLIERLQTEIGSNFLETKFLSSETRLSIENELDKVFSSYNIYTEREKRIKKENFCQDIENILDLLINKKTYCLIKFDGYSIFAFFKALSSLLNEVELQIQERQIFILTMDPLRIAIIEIILSNDSFAFYQNGKISFNLADLQKALKCKSSDKSEMTLMFGKEKLYITINSKKFKSQIERELNSIDFHQSDRIDINQLEEFEYTYEFILSKEKLDYLIDNFGIYSEIIEINCSKEKISFTESCEFSKNEITWETSLISDRNFNLIENEKENDGKLATVKGIFSFNFFRMLYKMTTILSKKDVIIFSICERFPLKAEICYPQLGNSILKFYISPRN